MDPDPRKPSSISPPPRLASPKHHPQLSIAEVMLSNDSSVAAAPSTRPASSRSGSASLDLAWDQTYLRITYLVSTMGPSASPALSATASADGAADGPRAGGYYDYPPDDVRLNAEEGEEQDEPGARGWTAVPRDKVRKKVAQIRAWRDEVGDIGDEAWCACSAAAGVSASAPSPTRALASPGADGREQLDQPRPCFLCGRTIAPPVVQVRDLSGVRKALRGIFGRRKKQPDVSGNQSDSPIGLDDSRRDAMASTSAPASPARTLPSPAPPDFPRTEMYRADLPQPAAPTTSHPLPAFSTRPQQGPLSSPSRRLPHDTSEDDEVLDPDDLSGSASTHRRGLLLAATKRQVAMDARLARAQRLLARSQDSTGDRGKTKSAA